MTAAATAAAGRVVAAVSLHDVERCERDGSEWLAKRRRWYAAPLVSGFNAYLAWAGADVRFLGGETWRAWESLVHRAVHGAEVRRGPAGAVLLPMLPGLPVDRVLASPARDSAARLHVVAAAVASLRALHRTTVPVPHDPRWPLSHGDAVLRNALFDDGVVRWIDFETRHLQRLPPARRHADDLWTLARSAVHVLGASSCAPVAAIVAAACDDPDVAVALRNVATRPPRRQALFRHAQTPVAADASASLAREFVRALAL